MTATTYMGTQLNVMQSERVIVQAMRSLELQKDADRRADWMAATGGKGSFESWLSERILHKLDVMPSRDSNVLNVSYTSPDPQASARMVNAVIASYIATTLDLRVEPAKRNNAFFDARAAHLRTAFENAQQKLSAFQREHGIVAADDRMDVETMRLNELNSQLVAVGQQAAESATRHGLTSGQAGYLQEVLSSPLVVSLTSNLAKEETRLAELTTQLGDNNPQVRQSRESIAQMKSRIAAETQRVAVSVGVTDSVNQNRLAKLRAEVDAQRARILSLRTKRDEAAVLLRDVESAKTAYDNVMARSSQTAVESEATQTNVSVIKEASVPALPSSPKVLINVVVGSIVGLLLGLVTAIARELRDPRLRVEADIVRGLKQPLLAALPRQAKLAGPSRLRLRLAGPLRQARPAVR